ncbi:M1 family metallopeptidase [Siansivirga zeaxanthinifaciens]|uniref:Peptidase M1 n=1 Tax=Siansivirga zeaxanthinifaciens CC-SAMT-1 TaxID=1454006 RepID=A0A0C5VWG4_9FLAO|nr:M1 family metallopeptidase [Siansivirga zeaxanthinifaciens]AJR03461.1 peptidase M1 [Siansivirga zeaxanthinifaciens CC-SAMT-1]
MKCKYLAIPFLFLSFCLSSFSQSLLSEKTEEFTEQDTLRGTITPERSWWDLTYYHLDIKINLNEKYISGKNTIQYKVLKENSLMQIDLQAPLKITKVIQNNEALEVIHNGNAHFIKLKNKQKIGTIDSLDVYYEGHPKEAVNAPWDGGFSWKKDEHGNDFIATSCQGLGASVWWPCKDHMYDEVDSMLISVNVPSKLMDVSNGRLRRVEQFGDTKTYHWFVNNPINNYGVNVNIGNYAHFSEVYNGEGGNLDMDYYVLKDNVEKAKEHFKDAPRMMKAFEYWFGPYPFYKDGYKLVEVPYLGMEHQSSVTYGNKYMKGYLGHDLSYTGWGLKFDFIIIHESGHEWFANNITNIDIADMWIHESFTNYSENLFVEYYYGKKAGAEYVIGTRKDIQNDRPIIGFYNVNNEGSGDMYNKGGNMLHTLRQLVEDDEKWRQILRGLNKTFYHQTVSTEQIENYLSKETGIDLTAFFNQYLRTIKIPTLEYSIKNKELKYRWTNIVADFDMPVKVTLDEKEQWLYPTETWKALSLESKNSTFTVDPNFYIKVSKI